VVAAVAWWHWRLPSLALLLSHPACSAAATTSATVLASAKSPKLGMLIKNRISASSSPRQAQQSDTRPLMTTPSAAAQSIGAVPDCREPTRWRRSVGARGADPTHVSGQHCKHGPAASGRDHPCRRPWATARPITNSTLGWGWRAAPELLRRTAAGGRAGGATVLPGRRPAALQGLRCSFMSVSAVKKPWVSSIEAAPEQPGNDLWLE